MRGSFTAEDTLRCSQDLNLTPCRTHTESYQQMQQDNYPLSPVHLKNTFSVNDGETAECNKSKTEPISPFARIHFNEQTKKTNSVAY